MAATPENVTEDFSSLTSVSMRILTDPELGMVILIDGDQYINKLEHLNWILPVETTIEIPGLTPVKKENEFNIEVFVFGIKSNLQNYFTNGRWSHPRVHFFKIPPIKEGADLAAMLQMGGIIAIAKPTVEVINVSHDTSFQRLTETAAHFGKTSYYLSPLTENLALGLIFLQIIKQNLRLSHLGKKISSQLRDLYLSSGKGKVNSFFLPSQRGNIIKIIEKHLPKEAWTVNQVEAEIERLFQLEYRDQLDLKLFTGFKECSEDCLVCPKLKSFESGSFLRIPDRFFDSVPQQTDKFEKMISDQPITQLDDSLLAEIPNWEQSLSRISVQEKLKAILYQEEGDRFFLIRKGCVNLPSYDSLNRKETIFFNDNELRCLATDKLLSELKSPIRMCDIRAWMKGRRQLFGLSGPLRAYLFSNKEERTYLFSKEQFYRTRRTKYYHRKDCSRIAQAKRIYLLDRVGHYKPCSTCLPIAD